MKLIIPHVDYVFDCGDIQTCCSIIIENQKLFLDTLMDISMQLCGNDGISVLSENDKVILIYKRVELLNQFVSFDMNQKNILNKVTSCMLNLATDATHFMETNQILADWERYLMNLSFSLKGNFEFTKVSTDTLIKAAGLKIEENYDNLGEQLIDYMELVQEYDARKLFIFVNLRSYMNDDDMDIFMQNILERQIEVLFMESSEHAILRHEKRYIVDADMCVIC